MKQIRLIALLITLVTIFWSCAENMETKDALKHAEALMEAQPEQSLEILEAIDRETLSSRKQRAKFSLLYSMALDKNFIDLQSDSIISPAVHYYKHHGTVDDRVKSLYYLARIQFNAEDYNTALITLMDILPLHDNSLSIRIWAQVHNLLAVTYNLSYMFSDSFKHIDLAYDYAIKCGDYKLADIILYRKAQLYINLRQYDEAEKLFLLILGADRIEPDTKSMVLCDYALAQIWMDEHDYGQAVRLYEHALKLSPSFYDVNHVGAYAYALHKTGNEVLAEHLFAQMNVMKDDNIEAIYNSWRMLVCRDLGLFEEAYRLTDCILAYQDSLFQYQFQNSAAKAQSDYWSLKSLKSEREKRNRTILLSLLIAMMALISILTYLIYKTGMDCALREKESLFKIADSTKIQLAETEEINREMEMHFRTIIESRDLEIESLRGDINDKEDCIKALRKEYAKMYKSQFKTLGDLCEAFIKAEEYKDSHRVLYEKVKDMLKEINGDKTGQKHFEKMIDNSLNNIMKHFREDFPKYNDNDYRFVSYAIIGFDATTLSIIFNMPSQAAVYMKKSRIKKQIMKSNSQYKAFYLEMLV